MLSNKIEREAFLQTTKKLITFYHDSTNLVQALILCDLFVLDTCLGSVIIIIFHLLKLRMLHPNVGSDMVHPSTNP